MIDRPMPKLDDLYQEVILDHNKNPRNFHKVEGANACSHGKNPLCGDDYYLYLLVGENGKIEKVGFEGQGCAISKSSASIMTTLVEGKRTEEAQALKDSFLNLLTKDQVSDEDRTRAGRLKIFEGVKQFPIRVKCAALIWRTLEDALKKKEERQNEISTE